MVISSVIYLPCPHCEIFVEIDVQEINCGIYRHAFYKSGQEVDPHETKETLERLIQQDLVYGCGKPFQFDVQTQKLISCEYF